MSTKKVGIVKVGAYVPWYRLTGEMLKGAWGIGGKSERAVANHDEDPVTLAVEAASSALDASAATHPLESVGALFLASTTAPLEEGLNASAAAHALDLGKDLAVADLSGSVKSGLSALLSALDCAAAGRCGTTLACASDMRLSEPGSPSEASMGDGAAAALVSDRDFAAVLLGSHSIARDQRDIWRARGESFVQSADPKFISEMGYPAAMKEAFEGLSRKLGIEKGAIAKVAFSSPDARTSKTIASTLGLSEAQVLAESPTDRFGDMGSASALLNLGAAIEKSKEGDKVACLGYGGGADALLFEVLAGTPSGEGPVERATGRASRKLSSYEKYLRFRRLVSTEILRSWTSPIVLWREEAALARLHGKRCTACGAIQYPPREVCWKCSSRKGFEDAKLARRGKIFTFTKDHLVPTPDPPVVMATCDLDGGGRFYGQMTDCPAEDVKVGMEVRLSYRRIHEGEGFPNYFWKLRPA